MSYAHFSSGGHRATWAGFIYGPGVAEIHTLDLFRRPLVYKQAQFPLKVDVIMLCYYIMT